MIYVLFNYESYYPSGGVDDIHSWQEGGPPKADDQQIAFFESIIQAHVDDINAKPPVQSVKEWWELVKLNTGEATKTTLARWQTTPAWDRPRDGCPARNGDPQRFSADLD